MAKQSPTVVTRLVAELDAFEIYVRETPEGVPIEYFVRRNLDQLGAFRDLSAARAFTLRGFYQQVDSRNRGGLPGAMHWLPPGTSPSSSGAASQHVDADRQPPPDPIARSQWSLSR